MSKIIEVIQSITNADPIMEAILVFGTMLVVVLFVL